MDCYSLLLLFLTGLAMRVLAELRAISHSSSVLMFLAAEESNRSLHSWKWMQMCVALGHWSSTCQGCAGPESHFLFLLLFGVWGGSWNSSLWCRNGGCRGWCCWPCCSQPCVQLVFMQQVAHLGPDFILFYYFSEGKVLNQATVLAWWLIVICPLTSPNHISSIYYCYGEYTWSFFFLFLSFVF